MCGTTLGMTRRSEAVKNHWVKFYPWPCRGSDGCQPRAMMPNFGNSYDAVLVLVVSEYGIKYDLSIDGCIGCADQ